MYILGFMSVDGDFFIFCLCMFVATMLMFTKFNNCYLIEKFLITYIILYYVFRVSYDKYKYAC